ncbi:MAG: cytochrome c oxidase subunit 3 [Sporichthyaceae bacterium]
MTATAAPVRERHVPGEVGLWVFILGDMVIFGLFFVMIMVLRGDQPEIYTASQNDLHIGLGVVNTIILLTSSLFVVGGMALARGRDRRAPLAFLAATFCGALFIAVKAVEYTALINDGHTPPVNDFYLYYFMFTGIHLGHVVLGMGALVVASRLAKPANTGKHRSIALEGVASFWHLVDLLWIMLFALLYLVA